MELTSSPTELTTAATDAVLAVLSLGLLVLLARVPWLTRLRMVIWGAVLALLGVGAVLAAVAHGFDLSPAVRAMLWRPMYLSLGLCVALFVAGGVRDLRGDEAARAVLPWAIAAGLGLFALTEASDNFTLFIAYEAVATVGTLGIYLTLWIVRGFPGAARMSLGVALTLVAAAIQVTPLSLRLIWRFDHNGLFHLAQIVALLVIVSGLRAGRPAVSTRVREVGN